jgi:hypothetical protein
MKMNFRENCHAERAQQIIENKGLGNSFSEGQQAIESKATAIEAALPNLAPSATSAVQACFGQDSSSERLEVKCVTHGHSRTLYRDQRRSFPRPAHRQIYGFQRRLRPYEDAFGRPAKNFLAERTQQAIEFKATAKSSGCFAEFTASLLGASTNLKNPASRKLPKVK